MIFDQTFEHNHWHQPKLGEWGKLFSIKPAFLSINNDQAGRVFDVVTQQYFTNSSYKKINTSKGVALDANSGGSIAIPISLSGTPNFAVTVLTYAYYDNTTSDQCLFSGGTLNDPIVWADTLSSNIRPAAFSGSAVYGTAAGLNGGFHCWGASIDDNIVYLYLNGEQDTSGGIGTSASSSTVYLYRSLDGKNCQGHHVWTIIFDGVLPDEEAKYITEHPQEIYKILQREDVFIPVSAGGTTAALTGTATSSINESDIVTGGKTVILTLTGDTFVTGTTSEDGIAGGSDSDKTGANKWDALIKTDLDNTDVVLSGGNTIATITLPAYATYDTDEQETITWTIPAASLTTSAVDVVCTPTFTVDVVSASAVKAGTLGLMGVGI